MLSPDILYSSSIYILCLVNMFSIILCTMSNKILPYHYHCQFHLPKQNISLTGRVILVSVALDPLSQENVIFPMKDSYLLCHMLWKNRQTLKMLEVSFSCVFPLDSRHYLDDQSYICLIEIQPVHHVVYHYAQPT